MSSKGPVTRRRRRGTWLAIAVIAGLGTASGVGAANGSTSHVGSVAAVSPNPAWVSAAWVPAALASTARASRAPASGPGVTLLLDEPSGAFAQQNRLIAQGITVAVAKLNAAGGIDHGQVRVQSARLDGLSPAAVQGKLRAAGPNAVLILPCDTNWQAPLARGAAHYGTLMLAPCDANDALARSLPTYWPVGMSGSEEATGLADFLHTIGGASAFVVNTPSMGFATLMAGDFRTAAQAAGIKVVGGASTPIALTPADIKRVATAISATQPRPGAIFSPLPPPYIDRLVAGLMRDGVHADVIGTSAMDTPLTLSDPNGAALANATFPSYGFVRQIPSATAFVQAYSKRFGRPVGAFPGLGFDTIGLLQDAAIKAHSTKPAAIQHALLAGIDDPGVALFPRSYHSHTDHNPVTTVSVEKISAGAFLPLLTSSPPAPSAGG